MSIQSERIRQLVEESKLSYQELEEKTGIKKSSLQRYASGTTSKIPLDAIEKLSISFNVSQAYLMAWSDEKEISHVADDLTEGEKKWLELYYCISKENRELLVQTFIRFGQLSEESQRIVMNNFLEDISR